MKKSMKKKSMKKKELCREISIYLREKSLFYLNAPEDTQNKFREKINNYSTRLNKLYPTRFHLNPFDLNDISDLKYIIIIMSFIRSYSSSIFNILFKLYIIFDDDFHLSNKAILYLLNEYAKKYPQNF